MVAQRFSRKGISDGNNLPASSSFYFVLFHEHLLNWATTLPGIETHTHWRVDWCDMEGGIQ